MPDAALFVLNPRHIPACIEAIDSLDIPTCWLSYMNEKQAADAANEQIRLHSFDRYVFLSDDTVPTQEALDLVLAQDNPVVTGYCNLDEGRYLDVVNLTVNTLPPPPSQQNSYHLMTREQVEQHPEPTIPTTFAGLSLTSATREVWLKHPLQVDPTTGGQMDYDLCYRLAQSNIPIVAAVGAYVHHVKERWCHMDENPEKRLLVGEREPQVRWSLEKHLADEMEFPKICPHHGLRDQPGIYCNQPTGRWLNACGKRLDVPQRGEVGKPCG